MIIYLLIGLGIYIFDLILLVDLLAKSEGDMTGMEELAIWSSWVVVMMLILKLISNLLIWPIGIIISIIMIVGSE